MDKLRLECGELRDGLERAEEVIERGRENLRKSEQAHEALKVAINNIIERHNDRSIAFITEAKFETVDAIDAVVDDLRALLK